MRRSSAAEFDVVIRIPWMVVMRICFWVRNTSKSNAISAPDAMNAAKWVHPVVSNTPTSPKTSPAQATVALAKGLRTVSLSLVLVEGVWLVTLTHDQLGRCFAGAASTAGGA